MRFNLACFTAAVLAASVAAVPLDSTKTVLVHREACPAPAPAPAPTPVPAPAPAPQPQSSEVCTANSQPSCCESVQSSSNSQVLDLFSQLGIDHQKASDKGPVGLTCTPITTALLNNNSYKCNSQPVCCQNNDYNGLVNLGCVPINLSIL